MVGRTQELVAVQAAVEAGAWPIVVSGDAGIGKSRLVTEVAAVAHRGGRIALLGHCLPLSHPLPMLPVVQMLRKLHRDNGSVLLHGLESAAPYVRHEVVRLLPELAAGATASSRPADRADGWAQERLFAAIGDVLAIVAANQPIVMIVEDLHWADQTTLDLFTYLQSGMDNSATTLIVTCRSDEVITSHVRGWLDYSCPRAADIPLRGLPDDAIEQMARDVMAGDVPPALLADVVSRTGGNPFFIEQVVATYRSLGPGATPGGLPSAPAALLASRIREVSAPARTVLAALCALGRPVNEALLTAVSDLDQSGVRPALHELTAAKLLMEPSASGEHAVRHALLAEAMMSELLPGERQDLHSRAAHALESLDAPAADIAWHWQRAGRHADEARTTAIAAAEARTIFAYSEAAVFGERAIALCEQIPDLEVDVKLDLATLYLQTVEALDASGRRNRAAALADRALSQFGATSDLRAAAQIRAVVAFHRRTTNISAALDLLAEAIALFDTLPGSEDQAMALLNYGRLLGRRGDFAAAIGPLQRALDTATELGVDEVAIVVVANLALAHFTVGDVADGFALIASGRSLIAGLLSAEADVGPAVPFALIESDMYLKRGELAAAEAAARDGFALATRSGRAEMEPAKLLLGNVVEALLERGETLQAMHLLEPHTHEPPGEVNWVLHSCRAVTEVRMGLLDAARERVGRVADAMGVPTVGMAREIATDRAEVAVWSGSPRDARPILSEVARRCEGTGDEIYWGELLVLGAQAAADSAERARAHRDNSALQAALHDLACVEGIADRMGQRPFTDNAFVARIPADRAQWEAERSRARGVDDPTRWAACADAWEGLGRPHRAAYAWWRCADGLLARGAGSRTATDPLRRAAALAIGMAPLLTEVAGLAARARIAIPAERTSSLAAADEPVSAPDQVGQRSMDTGDPYHLTPRERAVLDLVALGRTNAEIGKELYISPKTASVHVTNILRKLDVSNRTQAAALAARAGLLSGAELGGRWS